VWYNKKMKPDDLKNAPKLLAENIKIGYSPEFFIIGISSGSDGRVYSLTPGHAKRLQQYLTHELTEYEAKYGSVNAQWSPNVVSPVQRQNPPTPLS